MSRSVTSVAAIGAAAVGAGLLAYYAVKKLFRKKPEMGMYY